MISLIQNIEFRRKVILWLVLAIITVGYPASVMGMEFKITGRFRCEPGPEQMLPVRCILVVPTKSKQAAVFTDNTGDWRLDLPAELLGESFTIEFWDGKNLLACEPVTVYKEKLDPDNFFEDDFGYKTSDLTDCDTIKSDCEQANKFLDSLKDSFEKRGLPPVKHLGATSTLVHGVFGVVNSFEGESECDAQPNKSGAITFAGKANSNSSCCDCPIVPEGPILLELLYGGFSQNTGFSFVPTRNFDEAVFWNTSVYSLLPFEQISVQSDYDGFSRFGFSLAAGRKLHLAAGYARYAQVSHGWFYFNKREIPTSFESKEWMAVIGISSRVTPDLSIGITPKLIGQRLTSPITGEEFIQLISSGADITSSDLSRENEATYGEVDISLTARPVRKIVVGASLMNLFGTKLLSSELTGLYRERVRRSLRAYGLGIAFMHRQINLGANLYLREAYRAETSIGVSYKPRGWLSFHTGMAGEFDQATIGMSLFGMRYTFSYDEEYGRNHLFSSGLAF